MEEKRDKGFGKTARKKKKKKRKGKAREGCLFYMCVALNLPHGVGMKVPDENEKQESTLSLTQNRVALVFAVSVSCPMGSKGEGKKFIYCYFAPAHTELD